MKNKKATKKQLLDFYIFLKEQGCLYSDGMQENFMKQDIKQYLKPKGK